jgi:CheY-like chemotaxis protein
MVSARRVAILVVEDDDNVRELLREVLAEQGFSVSTAAHGAEALDLLEHGNKPSLILLDLLMPIMDGEEFLSELRTRERLRRIPVLVTSGTNARPPTAQGFVAKPFALATLFEEIRKYVP